MPESKKVVAIHQPNFFPWLGYFNKIARADFFLLMDNVQFPKKGGNWSNRVRFLINRQPMWVTMPVVRSYHSVRPIKEIQLDNNTPWRTKILRAVQTNYGRAPFYEQIFPFLTDLINNPTDSITDHNCFAIAAMSDAVKLDASRLIRGSTLDAEGHSTDLLINMVKAVGGTAYLCGGGASGYQEDEKFAAEGIELIYQNFQHPVYPQTNVDEFVPGLSIVDALMNCGFEDTGRLIAGESIEGAHG
jgi:hypothetical protein